MEEETFNEIYNQHYPAIYGFVHRRAGQDDVEDLTAGVFLRAWKQILSGVAVREWRRWLFAVAKNLLTDYYRSRYLEADLDERIVADGDVSEILAQREDYDKLRTLVASLPTRQRQILHMVLAGYEVRETAPLLGIANPVAHQAMIHAKRTLRTMAVLNEEGIVWRR